MCGFMMPDKFDPLYRIRRQEIELVLSELCIQSNTRILDIGCGSGVQSTFFSEKSRFVVSSDVNLTGVRFRWSYLVKCSAEYLPFEGNSFDVVYSSCVLEHIKNQKLALREMKRVLKRNGVLICVVPTFTWKMLQLILFYPQMIYRFMVSQVKLKRHEIKFNNRPRISLRYLTRASIHGEFEGNAKEAIAYRKESWVYLFETNDFYVYKIKKLLLYAPLGEMRAKNITVIPPSLRMEKITGLCSSIALFANLRDHCAH